MNQIQTINAFSYLPRQDGVKDGIIFQYEFQLSDDGKNWEKVTASGTFNNIENNPNRRIVKFKNDKSCRFIKLISKSTVNQNGGVSIAEIEVFVKTK